MTTTPSDPNGQIISLCPQQDVKVIHITKGISYLREIHALTLCVIDPARDRNRTNQVVSIMIEGFACGRYCAAPLLNSPLIDRVVGELGQWFQVPWIPLNFFRPMVRCEAML